MFQAIVPGVGKITQEISHVLHVPYDDFVSRNMLDTECIKLASADVTIYLTAKMF
jgi:hypothetical protein